MRDFTHNHNPQNHQTHTSHNKCNGDHFAAMALHGIPFAPLGDLIAAFAMDMWSGAVGQYLEWRIRGCIGFGVGPIVIMMMPLLLLFADIIMGNRSVLKVGSC